MIFLDTNVLYHIIHKTTRTEESLTLLEENPGDYVINMVVHNEIIYTSTMHYLKHKYGVSGTHSARKWIKKHGYPGKVIEVIRELLRRLNIRLIPDVYTEEELYRTLKELRLLPSDAIIALTCKHHDINSILTFDEDFKRVPWLKLVP